MKEMSQNTFAIKKRARELSFQLAIKFNQKPQRKSNLDTINEVDDDS